jgi:pre-mRNA-processing factor SLU7
VIDEYAKIEEEKRRVKEEELKSKVFTEKVKGTKAKKEKAEDDTDSEDSDEGDEDDEKYADSAAAMAKFDAKNRVSVRNLRIREDRAKYLYNLDANSAHYDSKTRTMRSDPLKGTKREGKSGFNGDNFVRYETLFRQHLIEGNLNRILSGPLALGSSVVEANTCGTAAVGLRV